MTAQRQVRGNVQVLRPHRLEALRTTDVHADIVVPGPRAERERCRLRAYPKLSGILKGTAIGREPAAEGCPQDLFCLDRVSPPFEPADGLFQPLRGFRGRVAELLQGQEDQPVLRIPGCGPRWTNGARLWNSGVPRYLPAGPRRLLLAVGRSTLEFRSAPPRMLDRLT